MKNKTIYYSDESRDEFSSAQIEARPIDKDYKYDRVGPLVSLFSAVLYRIVFLPAAFVYSKFILHQHTVGRDKLKQYKKTGFFIYGNHTQQVGDPFIPNIFLFPKKVSFIVHPNNVSIPFLGKLTPYLGAVPIPSQMSAYRSFLSCIKGRIDDKNAVVIYPEAHIWPYYTKIRPFDDTSFSYPVKQNTPVFCFVNTYKSRKHSKKPALITYIEGPFFSDASLSPRLGAKKLKDDVYDTMVKLSGKSDCEYIKYIKREAK